MTGEVTWKELYKRIYGNAFDPKTGTYRDVQQNLRLPAFSSVEESKIGDNVRLKEYKSGNMAKKIPDAKSKKKQPSSKSSSDNWAIAIYKNSFSQENSVWQRCCLFC